jgi:hypothetical protein
VQIQPYFPEQIEISGNVAAERYLVTLGFILRVMAGHFLSVAMVASVAAMGAALTMEAALAVAGASLLALTLVRRLLHGRQPDNVLSALLMAPTVWSFGNVVRLLSDAGEPVWVVGAAYLASCAYGLFCGRDFSFVGQFIVTVYATLAALVAGVLLGHLTMAEAAVWGAVALVYAFYYVYDLAALLSRRRLGEEPAAVADLYRDLLNFLTYSVRVVLHWRRFRFI